MLVQIELKPSLNEEYVDRGVIFSTNETDDPEINRLFKAELNPKHEFWKNVYQNSEPECTTIFKILEDNRTGIYWGWDIDNSIEDYFNVDLIERFPTFDKLTGQFFNDDELREVYFNKENKTETSTGKQIPDFNNLISSYGVADNIDQVFFEYKSVIDNNDIQIVIGLEPIRKDDQPEDGGWRWHKWGKYIGIKQPQHEYLYDEKDIDEVLIFHVLVVKLN